MTNDLSYYTYPCRNEGIATLTTEHAGKRANVAYLKPKIYISENYIINVRWKQQPPVNWKWLPFETPSSFLSLPALL